MYNIKNRVIIFDLEATCIENNKNYTQETIEIGAIDNNGKEFNSFIKPIINPKLTEYCKELTTITQKDVDNAKTFNLVILDFIKYIDGATILSWGAYDRKQLIQDLKLYNMYEYCDLISSNFINLKDYYKSVTGFKAKGTRKVMSKLGLTFDGTQHRAIDDARNLQKIYFYLENIKKDTTN